MAEFKDLAITGELIVSMPESERWFELMSEPKYEPIQEGKEETKLGCLVRLSNGQSGTYYPNKTSARKMATINKTTDMVQWVGKKYFWGFIEKRMINGAQKDCIYVTSYYPVEKKA